MTSTFTGRTSRNTKENLKINQFETGFNEFEEEFSEGLERGRGGGGSGASVGCGGPVEDSNAEMAMKFALEMTGAAGKSWSFCGERESSSVCLPVCLLSINVVQYTRIILCCWLVHHYLIKINLEKMLTLSLSLYKYRGREWRRHDCCVGSALGFKRTYKWNGCIFFFRSYESGIFAPFVSLGS